MVRERCADGDCRIGDGFEGPHILIGVTSAQTCLVLPARLRALSAGGMQVSLVSSPGAMAACGTEIDGVAAHGMPMAREISPWADLTAFVRMVRLLRRMKPEVVEFSTPKAGILGCVAAWICRIPVRVYFIRGLRLETTSAAMRLVLLWSERIAAACAHVVLVNSDSLRERALLFGIAGADKVVLLGAGSSNGVDISRFSPGESGIRAELGIPAEAQVIGFVGRLTADKGVPELLEAFAAILRKKPDCYLLLVGWFDAAKDALGIRLRARIEGHPRIVCTGYVADTAPYYRAMDLLVHPSWREGFPNVVLEAAASGVPAVVTNCTGSRDAIVPNVTGILVEPGNPGEIVQAVLRVLGDRKFRDSMAQAARNRAVGQFEEGRVLGEMVHFYRQLLTSSASEISAKDTVEPATGWTASL